MPLPFAESELQTVVVAGKVSIAMTLTAIIYPGEETNVMIAQNPETGTTTQGKTVQEALDNLKEAVALYLGEFPLKPRSKPLLTTFDVEPVHA